MTTRDPAEPRDYYDEYDPRDDPDYCERCGGEGKIPTTDFESYFGANFKPCPVFAGNPCTGEPPTS